MPQSITLHRICTSIFTGVVLLLLLIACNRTTDTSTSDVYGPTETINATRPSPSPTIRAVVPTQTPVAIAPAPSPSSPTVTTASTPSERSRTTAQSPTAPPPTKTAIPNVPVQTTPTPVITVTATETPVTIAQQSSSPSPTATSSAPATPTAQSLTVPGSTSTAIPNVPMQTPPNPVVVDVVAESASNAAFVRFSHTVHVRGDIWLETSGGRSANAEAGGSKRLGFGAGELTGTVEIQGIGYGPGAALRDIDGNDVVTGLQPVMWEIGSRPVSLRTRYCLSCQAEVESITFKDGYWRVRFTKPVRVVGDVVLETDGGSDRHLVEPIDKPSVTPILLFEGGGARPTTWFGVRDGNVVPLPAVIRDPSGRAIKFDFEPLTWYGFPRPVTPTMADCVHDAYFDGNIDSIRADTIANTNPNTLSDEQRFAWYEFLSRNSSHLKHSCVALWSEEITSLNAENRNEQYSSCVAGVQSRIRQEEIEYRAAWVDLLALLVRPYTTLTTVERAVLRSQLDSDDCSAYYPQLFSGRWIPILER